MIMNLLILCHIFWFTYVNTLTEIRTINTTSIHYLKAIAQEFSNINITIVISNSDKISPNDLFCTTLENTSYNISESLQLSNGNDNTINDFLANKESIDYCISSSNDSDIRELYKHIELKLNSDVHICCFDVIKNEAFSCGRQLNDDDSLFVNETYIYDENVHTFDNCLTTAKVHLLHKTNKILAQISRANESEKRCLFHDNSFSYSCLQTIKEDCYKDCYRKCCPIGHLFSYTKNKCVISTSENIWLPNLEYIRYNEIWNNSINYHVGFPECKRFFALNRGMEENREYEFHENSSLYVFKYDTFYAAPNYCVDLFSKNEQLSEEAIICFPEKDAESEQEKCDFIHANIYSSFLIVSCIFLLLAIFVYLSIPELYSKLNGKCVIANTSTLMFSYVCLISHEYASPIPINTCPILGLSMQYFALSSFFWTNVMCFDVWRSLRSYRYIGATKNSWKRFLKYCLYAFGIPLVIYVVTACLHYIPSKSHKEYIISPGFGVTTCFFTIKDTRAWWAYFYGFILLIMVSNLFFFLHLLLILHKERSSTDVALQRNKQKKVVWLKLYAKLFVLMGVTWIFEIVSWMDGNCKFWIWSDSINALRGLFIFIIFVCKRSIWNKLKDKNSFMSSFRSSTSPKLSKMSSRSRFYVDIKMEIQT